MALICDTGPLYAAMDPKEIHHEACSACFDMAQEPIVVPAPVVVELEWISVGRLGPAPFDAFLAEVEDRRIRVEPLTVDDYRRIRALCSHYEDLSLGLVDASVIALAERLGERKVASLDQRHFRAVRPKHVESLKLLPLDG